MVNLKTIRLSNQSLQTLAPGIVAVFAGATSGIGLATLKQFAKYVNAPKAFIIGRNKEKGSQIVDDLKIINSSGTYVFIQGEFSLIKEVDRISAEIKKHVAEEEKGENHVDILCMSTNYLSLGERKETAEGIETARALQLYSRQRLIMNLLPLLKKSVSPRVVSIFGAGDEGAIDFDDIDVKKPAKFPTVKALGSSVMMSALMLEEHAKANPTVSFVFSHPGIVRTGIVDSVFATAPGLLWYPLQIPRYTIAPLFMAAVGQSPEEAGDKILFLSTSARYPPAEEHADAKKIAGLAALPRGLGVARPSFVKDGKGNGVYRVKANGEVCPENKLLNEYREKGIGKVVYEHMVGVFEQAVAKGT